MDTAVKPENGSKVATQVNGIESLRASISKHLIYTIGKDAIAASKRDWLYAVSTAVRDRLIERWMDTTRRTYQQDANVTITCPWSFFQDERFPTP